MLRFLQRPGSNGDGSTQDLERPLKKPRVPGDGPSTAGEIPADQAGSMQEPATFLTWNCNSLPGRCKEEATIKGLRSLVTSLDPDVIALQEVRITAHAPDKAKRGDGQIRDRGKPRDNDKASKEEWLAVRALMEQEPFRRYQVLWSLADWRYGGTATLVKKTLARPTKTEYNLDASKDRAGRSCHDESGRICLLQYPSGLTVLNTYAPNNGWKDESFQRRREWDARLHAFVAEVHAAGRQLVWLGDLNVAHRDADVSHPEFFRVQADKTAPKPAPADAGQPGFTPNEQLRFGKILQAGQLVDAFRHLHPATGQLPSADQPAWTWRGSHHPTDKYHARAMRIDYMLVAEALRDRVAEVRIIGHSFDRKDFYGSDHCPLFMKLRQPEALPAQPATSQQAAAGEQAQSKSSCGGGEGTGRPDLELQIEHDATSCEFAARLPDASSSAPAAGDNGADRPYLSYAICTKAGGRVMDIQHTYTPQHMRGRGVAEKLCVAAFEFCRSQGLQVIPSCTYVRDRFLASHPDLASLVLTT